MLAEDDPELEPFYPAPEDEAGGLLNVDLEEAVARFLHEREELVARLRELPPEAWERPAGIRSTRSTPSSAWPGTSPCTTCCTATGSRSFLRREEWPSRRL